MKTICPFAEVKPGAGRVPTLTNQDKGGGLHLMKTISTTISTAAGLLWMLSICALGVFAVLLHWNWLDNKCRQALEE